MNDEHASPDIRVDNICAQEEIPQRGRLKIFFGACAGVGKTYAMLNDAQSRYANEAIDVFIGIVETHGREEVEKLTQAIPGFALQTFHRRGVTLKEFDLDSALVRKPALVLIDELAHTNVSGTRHPKRWQDVEELLANGIDVYTTLNVQHLESLNDIVANVTGIQVRETVPDTIFDNANEIELIDTPPDEILKRLSEGKIYLAPEIRQRALDHFFKKGNLIALRELALRRAAEGVNAQMAHYSAGQGLKEPLIAERILVCVGHDALSTRVIRHAKRLTARTRASWTAVYVETSRHYRLDKQGQKNVERNLRLAEKMGAKTKILKGSDAVEELVAFARQNNITRIVVGRSVRAQWRDKLFGSLADKLIRESGNIEIMVIPDNATIRSGQSLLSNISLQPQSYAYVLLAISLCTIAGLPLRDRINAVNFSMFYLVGVVAAAARFGLLPAIAASLLSIAAFDFFFTEPYYSFVIHDTSYLITLPVLLAASIIVSSLAARLRLQAMFFRERDSHTTALYGLTSELAATRGHEAIAEVAARHIRQVFDCIVSILTLDDKNEFTTHPGGWVLRDIKDEAVARWCFDNKQPAGLETTTMPGSGSLCLPLLAGDACLGVLNLKPGNKRDRFDSEQLSLLDTFSSLIASALQRAHASQDAEKAKVEAETERLRNILLSSVSHDLRTPLASVRGSIEAVLASSRDTLSFEAKDLLETACRQSERLTRIVSDLLAMNRLETGGPLVNRQPYYIDEVIGSAISHAKPWMGDRILKTDLAPHLPLIHMDGALVEQLLVNLLENAVKYTPENGIIRLHVIKERHALLISVSDNGCGIPAGEDQKIFEKFYRVKGNSATQGSGLGLAICKAIVMAHGGEIWAENNEMGGLTIALTLPLINASLSPNRASGV